MYLSLSLKESTAARLLGEEPELTLGGLEARLSQASESLLARLRLLAAHNPPALIADQILARQTTRRVLGGAVKDHRLGAHRAHTTTDHTGLVSIVRSVIHFLTEQQIFFRGGQGPAGLPAWNDLVLQPVLDVGKDRARV